MRRLNLAVGFALLCTLVFGSGLASAQEMAPGAGSATLLSSGLEGASGSTIGPDGTLYVTEGAAGRIARVDLDSGEVTVFASGLPPQLIPLGGVMDVAFVDDTAYALVTLVGEDVGGSDVVGIYEIDGPDSFTVVADIGAYAMENVPTNTPIDVPTGVQYAMEPHGDGFLVTDGHHNKVFQVGLDGTVTELAAFDNIVPTGLALSGDMVYMGEAGPIPHIPDHGKVVSLDLQAGAATDVASGARLIVDVESGPDGALYALAQGDWEGEEAGAPALPNSGSLLKVNEDGTLTVVAEELNLPTSVEFVGDTAYVVSAAGEVWAVELQAGCSLGTLSGAYVFAGHGSAVGEDGAVMMFDEAGILHPDGQGSATGIISASMNGERVARGEVFAGAYEMVADCVFAVAVEDGPEVDVYLTASGDLGTYASPGISGVLYRQ